MRKNVLVLVDSIQYVQNNCFQHQLISELKNQHNVVLVSLEQILGNKLEGSVDVIVSCLKLRTLYRNARLVSQYLGDKPIVMYEQDPRESFKDGGAFKGAYHEIRKHMNVKLHAVTTQWWADHINAQGMPCVFVPMWVLPEYCDPGPRFVTRDTPVGFIGTVHKQRFELFEHLRRSGVTVDVSAGSVLGYRDFLGALSNIQIFVHNEDISITIDGIPSNIGGFWIKDVEAASRGCFSIRNRPSGSETYLAGIDTVRLYDTMDEVPDIIHSIMSINPEDRQHMIDETVDYIRDANKWKEAVEKMTS